MGNGHHQVQERPCYYANWISKRMDDLYPGMKFPYICHRWITPRQQHGSRYKSVGVIAKKPESHMKCGLCLPVFLLFFLFPQGCGFGQTVDTLVPVTIYNVEEGLEQSTVYQVLQDQRGLIWLATGGGLQCFDGYHFRSFHFPEDFQTTSLPGAKIIAMAEMQPGEMALSTGSTLFHFNSITGIFRPITDQTSYHYWLFNTAFLEKPICWSSAGMLYLTGDKRLYPLNVVFREGSTLPQNFIPEEVIIADGGKILIYASTGTLELVRQSSRHDTLFFATWIPELHSPQTVPGKREEQIRHWGFVSSEGVAGDTIRPFIRDVLEDRSGNLWIGTDGNGLLFHPAGVLRFDLAQIGFTRCLTWFDGKIWAGTFGAGLFRLDPKLRAWSRINKVVFDDQLYIFDITVDQAGRLWVATAKGLFVVGRDGSVLYEQIFTTASANFLSVSGSEVYLSTYDRLFSCQMGEKPSLTLIRAQTQVRKVLAYRGYIWLGNQFGLFRKEASAGVLEAMIFRESSHLGHLPVYDILPVDGAIWVATERGIARYTLSGEAMPVPEFLKSLNHEFVYALVEDSLHRVWFSGNKGIGFISANRDHIIRFSARNNLQSMEYNSNASLVTPFGAIYFGGIKGINGIPAGLIPPSTCSPSVTLFSLNIADTSYTMGVPPDSLTVFVGWKEPHVSGSIFSPQYPSTESIRYSFYLEGFDKEWSRPEKGNRFVYRNLPPGEYRLYARGSNQFDEEGEAALLLTVIIRPPFWRTGWFIMVALFLLILLIVLTVRKIQEIRYRNLLREIEQRNAIDRERLRISQDMHDEIGSSLTQISIMSEILKKSDHDQNVRTHMISKISDISGKVIDEMSDIIWAMNPKNDNLGSFFCYLREHASEYLSTADIEAHFTLPGGSLDVAMTSDLRRNLYLVVKEALHNIVSHSGATRVEVKVTWRDRVLGFEITDNGRGFDPAHVSQVGNGLLSMRKRVESLGGSYQISSAPGRGTSIAFSVTL